MDVLHPALTAWASTADTDSRSGIVATAKTLDEALVEHLEQEEADVLPLMHDHLAVAEWDAAQDQAMAISPTALTAKLVLAGTVLEDADQAERVWFLSLLPLPARLIGRPYRARRYLRYSRDLRRDVAR